MHLTMSEFVFYGVTMMVFAGVVVLARTYVPEWHHLVHLLIGALVALPCGLFARYAYDRSRAPGPESGGFDDRDAPR